MFIGKGGAVVVNTGVELVAAAVVEVADGVAVESNESGTGTTPTTTSTQPFGLPLKTNCKTLLRTQYVTSPFGKALLVQVRPPLAALKTDV